MGMFTKHNRDISTNIISIEQLGNLFDFYYELFYKPLRDPAHFSIFQMGMSNDVDRICNCLSYKSNM